MCGEMRGAVRYAIQSVVQWRLSRLGTFQNSVQLDVLVVPRSVQGATIPPGNDSAVTSTAAGLSAPVPIELVAATCPPPQSA